VWFLFRSVAECRTRGLRAVQVLYQGDGNPDKRASDGCAQAREKRSDNFFNFVTQETHGDTPEIGRRA